MRSASARSGAFKEKYVSLCEDLFGGRSPVVAARDRGIQGRSTLQRFWDEFLLLKVNQEFLAQCISSRSEEALKQEIKPVVNELFTACVSYLGDGNVIRVAHALETLIVVLREIFRKRFSQQGLTITMLVAGSSENADAFFKRLISSVGALLAREDVEILIKSLGLRLYLTILTATDNVNSNPIASYFFSNDILESLVLVLSVKVTAADRKQVELDVVLNLLLLLLWRESENLYILKLSSPSAPLPCLLNIVASLFSTPLSTTPKHIGIPESQSPGWDDVVGYVTSFFGLASVDQPISKSTAEECNQLWCGRSCGLALLYFLVYLNPAYSSSQLWPAMVDDAADNVLTNIWLSVLKSFMRLCQEHFLTTVATKTGVAQGKVALTTLRCMLENPLALNFFSYRDTDFALRKADSRLASPVYIVPFRSIACVIVDMAGNILAGPLVDADLSFRAAVLVPLVLRHVKAQAWQLSSSSFNSSRLWKALINCCTECAKGSNFQKPGVSELAELISGVLEWCLATSQDIFVSSEDTEALHAEVMCNVGELDLLQKELLVSCTAGNLSSKSLVNVTAVKHHYEVQIATLGVRVRPSYEQALAGVRKKGLANLKLKLKHPGPGRLYSEGTTDVRVLRGLVKLVVNEQRKLYSAVPKLETQALPGLGTEEIQVQSTTFFGWR